MNNGCALWVPTIASSSRFTGVDCFIAGVKRIILFNKYMKKLNKTV